MKHNKYNVSSPERRTWDGKVYPSMAEMMYARDVVCFARVTDNLLDYIEQPRISLGVRENVYVPDFLLIPHPHVELPYYVDVKGVETPAFKKVKKLWARYGRLDLHIVKLVGKKFKTSEIIRSPLACRTVDPLPA